MFFRLSKKNAFFLQLLTPDPYWPSRCWRTSWTRRTVTAPVSSTRPRTCWRSTQARSGCGSRPSPSWRRRAGSWRRGRNRTRSWRGVWGRRGLSTRRARGRGRRWRYAPSRPCGSELERGCFVLSGWLVLSCRCHVWFWVVFQLIVFDFERWRRRFM